MGTCCQVLVVFLFFLNVAWPFHTPSLSLKNGLFQFPFKRDIFSRNGKVLSASKTAWIDSLINKSNNTDSLLKIIEFGNLWYQSMEEKVSNMLELTEARGYYQVPGCLATVKCKVSVDSQFSPPKVIISGSADSQVSLGMLAMVSKLLDDHTVEHILSLSPHEYAKSLGLHHLFPLGRLNGFSNMIALVQQRIQAHFSPPNNNTSPAMNTIDHRSEEVAMLFSGGVDSSVALQLLLLQGYKVRAYYLKIWLEDNMAHLNSCPWEEDLTYVTKTCEQLGVPLEVVSLQQAYYDHVVQYTIDRIKHGHTPNPDIMCNSMIKFGVFYDLIGKYHTKIATGHYAQLRENPFLADSVHSTHEPKMILYQSPDTVKDQSYFLCQLNQSQLNHCLFPIGVYTKSEVRQLARQYQLPSCDRKDSQGICFLGKLKFNTFINHYLGHNPGPIYDYSNQSHPIGQHQGLWFHTIGQRKGIVDLLAPAIRSAGPWYVVAKHLETNSLFVTSTWDSIEWSRRMFEINELQWFVSKKSLYERAEQVKVNKEGKEEFRVEVQVKVRHSPKMLSAWLYWTPSHTGSRVEEDLQKATNEEVYPSLPSSVRVELFVKDKGIAPGQYTAIYLQSYCIGAGVIFKNFFDDLKAIGSLEKEP